MSDRKRNKYGRKLCLILCILLFGAGCFCPAVFAAGDGSGGGAGAIVPLYMDWSYPADGASDVSVTPVIQCKFSHNVAQYNVADRNKTLITLKEADGTNVDITVFVADAQLQFDKRQFLYVSPVKPLSYGTKYILTIHEGIQAKNNMATDEEQTVTFTTEYGRSSFNTPLVTPPVSNDFAEAENRDEGSGSTAAESDSGEGDSSESDSENDTGDSTAAAGSEKSGGTGSGGESDDAGASSEESSTSQEGASSDNAESSLLSSDRFRTGLIVLILFLAGIFGGMISAVLMKKREKRPWKVIQALQGDACDETEHSPRNPGSGAMKKQRKKRMMKHTSLLLAAALAAGSVAAAIPPDSYAAVPETFTVRLKIGDTVVSEKSYTDEELRAMKQTRQMYSGIDEEGLPCTVAAEGILMSELVESQGADASEIESVSIYGKDDWTRNMTNSYLYGVERFRYPHISEAYRIENGMEEEENGGEETSSGGTEDVTDSSAGTDDADVQDSGSVQTQASAKSGEMAAVQLKAAGAAADASALKEQDPQSTSPMLALRSVVSQLQDEVPWSALSTAEGYRFCFGQLNPTDGCYLMYGYNLQGIDIKISAAGEFAEKMGMQDTEGKKKMISGGADSAGSADVEGPYTNPFTGETIDSLPNELTVQVGYFGTEYYTVKTFTFEEIAAMPLIRQAYSSVGSDGTNGIMTAMGVRLVDLITAAGIDVDSVEKIGFYQGSEEGASGVTASKAYLIDMNRYYYPNLTAAWNYTTGGKGAARSAVRVDTLIALKDYWDEKSTVPDFYRLDGTHRYHLVYGQTSAKSNNLDKSMMWIDTIKIQLYGSPSDENWMDAYLGKVLGTGDGNGTGIGGGGSGSSSSESEQSAEQSAQTEKEEFETADSPLEKVNTAGKHVYEIAGGSVSYSLGSERNDYRLYIAVAFALVFLSGAGISFLAYRRRMADR